MEGPFNNLDLDRFHNSIRKENKVNFNYGMNIDSNKVNMRNGKGETALHVACKHPGVNAFIRRIISKTENVNVQNYWKQTPLHNAAAVRSVETMKLLLQIPEIDVTLKDVNGYTALHTFVSYCQDFDEKTNEGIRVLVGANIDVNAQTNYGQTILHLASIQDGNSEILDFIVRNYQNIDLEAVNILGENFLHIYVMTEIGDNCRSLFERLRKANYPVLQKLLNQQDASGSTPWCLMLENGELTTEHFCRIMDAFGIILDASDHLGNTALHRRVGKGGAIAQHHLEICNLMLKKGIDKNRKNIFGQSAASVLFYEDVYNMFQENKIDFTLTDNWGRIPLFYMLHR